MAILTPIRVTRFAAVGNRARNLVSAAVAVAKAKIQNPNGPIIAPPEVAAERLDICRHHCTGNHWREDGNLGLGKCALCTCCRLKHSLAALACPLGLWKAWRPNETEQ